MAVETPLAHSATVALPEPQPSAIWRLSVAQYHAMARSGILEEDAPVELLEGFLVVKMTKNPSCNVAKGLFRDALARIMPPGWFVGTEDPLTTADSEPEPDVVVLRGERRDYAARHPTPAEVGLVAEVADTNLLRDRSLKKRVYAHAGIPTYWIVNLVDRRIEVYTDPTSSGAVPDYTERTDYAGADGVPVVIDGQAVGRVGVADVLP